MIINLDKFRPAGETEIIIQEVVKNEIDFGSIGYNINNDHSNMFLQIDLSKSIDKQNEFNNRPNPEKHDSILSNTDLRYLPNVDTLPIKDMESMFAGNTNAESVSEIVDFDGCARADLVFDGCNNLKYVNMVCGAGEVISAVGMFKDCWKLERIFEDFQFPSLANAEAMFLNCYHLISLPWFDTRSVTNFTGMFAFCSKDAPEGLEQFRSKDRPLYMNNATSAIAMAEYSGLKELYIANIGNLNSTNRMFAGCSQLENLWILGSPGNFLSSNSKYREMFFGPDDPTDCFDNLTIHLDATYDWTVFTDFLTSINIKYEMFNSSVDIPWDTDIYGNPNKAIPVTIAEFTAAEPDTNQWYELTGEIKAMPVMEMGAIIIQDDTGVAFIDGTVDSPKLEIDESFMNIGAYDYDIITLRTRRLEGMINTADLGDYTFGEAAIGGGGTAPAIYVSHIDIQ